MKKQNEVKFSNDLFFKYLLTRDTELSLSLRKKVIKLIFGIDSRQLKVKNPEINQSHVNEKSIILDINVEDDHGNVIDIELQMSDLLANNKRFQYYGDRLLCNQLDSGEDYYHLHLVLQGILINRKRKYLIENFISRNEYGEIEEDYLHHRTYINMQNIDEILKEKTKEELSDLERLCYLFIKNSYDGIIKEDKDDIIRMVIEMYHKFKEDEDMYSLGVQREHARIMEISRQEEFYDKGHANGVIIGIEQGKIEELIKSCQKNINYFYQVECLEWLQSLDINQLEKVQDLSFEIKDFDELKQEINKLK